MPCDTISQADVDLGKVNKGLLTQAMDALNIRNYTIADDGTVTIQGRTASPELTSQIKQAYSKQVVLSQAKRFGWKVTEKQDGKLLVQKSRL